MLSKATAQKIVARLNRCARCNHEHDSQEWCGRFTKAELACRCPGFVHWAQPRGGGLNDAR